MYVIELNACKDEWFVAIKDLQEGKFKVKKVTTKEKRKRTDVVCGQHTNACKLGAKWDGEDFRNNKSWWQKIIISLIIKKNSFFM
jgi:hypothetical protein